MAAVVRMAMVNRLDLPIGTVAGTIVGALIIGVLNNTLDLMNVSAFLQQIVKGCIIVGAVILDQLENRGGK
jgi:inositol transport system permease protein